MGRGGDRCAAFTPPDFPGADESPTRYRNPTVSEFRNTEKGARAMFPGDIRGAARRTSPDVRPISLPDRPVLAAPNAQPAEHEGPAIRRTWNPATITSLSGGFLHSISYPESQQGHASYISLELALGQVPSPSYTPYVLPRIADSPWPAALDGRATSVSRRRDNMLQSKRVSNPQALPLQDFLLYQLRFPRAAELRGAFALFGGLAHQMNRYTSS